MNVSFAPLRLDAVEYLSAYTGVDFRFGVPFMPPNWFCVTARDDEGGIAGVLACEFKNAFCAWFNAAITDQRCMSRRLLRAMFTALFSKAVRITAEVDVTNIRALKQMQRLGFVHEGYCRRAIEGVRDAYVFGMLRDDCPWLRTPTFSAQNFGDGHLVNAKNEPDLALTEDTFKRPNLFDLGGRQLGHFVALTALVVGMAGSFGSVGFSGCPANVPFVDASANTAGVSGIRHAGRSGAVHGLAREVVNALDSSAHVNLSVTLAVQREGPDEAVIPLIGENAGQIILYDAGFCFHSGIVEEV